MTPTRFIRRTAVRIGVVFAGLFSMAIIAVFTILYFVISNDLGAYVKQHVQEVSDTLAAVGETGGREALIRMVGGHVDVAQSEEDVYLLTDDKGAFLAGNVRAISYFEGWRSIPWNDLALIGDWPAARTSTAVVGKWTTVKGGRLFVADGNGDVNDAQNIVLDGLGWGVTMAGISAVLGGLLVGFSAQRRVTAMGEALNSVAQGALATRIPLTHRGDDLDHVATLINATLDRLQRLILDVKQVTTDIAHDLKTPIGRIRQKLETLQSAPNSLETYRATVEDTLTDIDNVIETFEALLRIAEIEAGARKANFVALDLQGIVANVCDALEPVAEDAGHRFEKSLPEFDGLKIQGDRQLLNQLFVNLIENAIRHCPHGSIISVALQARAGTLSVTVADNGPGIPTAERANVLKRLYRLEKSRTTPGSGLGLSLATAIADLHGATIILADNHPGLAITVEFQARA